LYNLNI